MNYEDIKFRIFDTQLKKMDYFDDIIDFGRFVYEFGEISKERYHVMQYIGLNDKFDDDIYVGDILRNNSLAGNGQIEVKYGEYTYSMPSMRGFGIYFELKNCYGENITYAPHDVSELEMIGNIYDGVLK